MKKEEVITKAIQSFCTIPQAMDNSMSENIRAQISLINLFEEIYDAGYNNAMEKIRNLQRQN